MMFYTYIIFNFVSRVSRVEILELAVAIPWDVLQAVHVLRCCNNGKLITITSPDNMNEGRNLPRGIRAAVMAP